MESRCLRESPVARLSTSDSNGEKNGMACTSVHCSSALDKTQPVVMPEISALAVSGDGTLENVGIGVHLTPKLSVVGGCPNFRRSVLGRIEADF